jgi:thioredoxin-related protein
MKLIIYLFIILSSLKAFTQEKIDWINFEDLPALQAQNSKPIFIYIHADWCVYCKKMKKVSFKDKSNVNLLNDKYYALKFNLETESDIIFNNEIYKNQELKIHRQPKHELAKFLTGKQDKIPLPAIVILDQNFKVIKQLHTYLSPKQLYLLINQ